MMLDPMLMKMSVQACFILVLMALPLGLRSDAVAEQKISNAVKVEFLSPVKGQRVHGPLRIEARVNDPAEVEYIEFYIQEQGAKDRYVWRDFQPPYFWGGDGQTVDTTLFEDGPASVVAFCFAKASLPSVAQERVSFVIDNRKPIIKITAPLDGSTVNGVVQVQVDASDQGGIIKKAGVAAVSVYFDGQLVQRMTSAPFLVAVNTCLSAPGLHSIRAVAEDTEGLTASDAVVIRVGQDGTAVLNRTHKRK